MSRVECRTTRGDYAAIVLGEGALDARAATPGFALKARVGLPALCIDASTV
jgi:hypothetical protein